MADFTSTGLSGRRGVAGGRAAEFYRIPVAVGTAGHQSDPTDTGAAVDRWLVAVLATAAATVFVACDRRYLAGDSEQLAVWLDGAGRRRCLSGLEALAAG